MPRTSVKKVNLNTIKARMRKIHEEWCLTMGLKSHQIIWRVITHKKMVMLHGGPAVGLCYGGNGWARIYYSRYHLEKHWDDEKYIRDLVGHELVHAKLPRDIKPHGVEFRRECTKYDFHSGM